MKEVLSRVEGPVLSNVEPLTNGDRSPYALLRAPNQRGIIFMVDSINTGETARGTGVPKTPDHPAHQKSPDKQDSPAAKTTETITPKAIPRVSVGEAWEKATRGRELTADEQWMVRQGIYPMAGGAVQTQHEADILATAPGSSNEMEEVEKLLLGDQQHRFLPEHLPQAPPEIQNRIRETMGRIVETLPYQIQQIPPTLLAWVAHYPEYADQLITRIIMTPFATPSVQYTLEGLYTTGNLTVLMDIMEVNERRQGREGYENSGTRARILYRAAQFYHEMNRVVNSGQVDQYAQISPSFPTEYFEYVKKIPGVAQAKRAFEMSQSFILARDGTIDNTNFPEIRKIVTELLTEENQADVISGGYGQNGHLIDWELKRAIDLAESMLTIEFRSAEKMSMGKMSRISDIASVPQESARRLLDWFRELGFKFSIDEVQGGVNLMKRTKEKFRTLVERKYPWLNARENMRLKKLNNIDVTDFELAGLFGVHGVWEGYRVNIGSLDRIILTLPNLAPVQGERPTMEKSVYDYLDKLELAKVVGQARAEDIIRQLADSNDVLTGKRRRQFRNSITATDNEDDNRKGFRKNIKNIKVKDILYAARKVNDAQRMERMNRILEEVFRPLVDHTSVGLGALLSAGGIYPPNLYKVREMIWEKVIKYDPLTMALMLAKLKFKDGVAPSARSLGQILYGRGFRDPDPIHANNQDRAENDPRWKELRKKLVLAHEKRMRGAIRAQDPEVASRPQGGKIDHMTDLDLGALTPEERQIVDDIGISGRAIAKDLSFVRFPYTVFLDDLPFEDASYKEMGPEFFRRRTGSDLPAFVQAQKAWVTLIGKAGTLKAEERIKQFEAIMDGTADVMGADWAQDYITDALFEADCEFINQYPWAQQFIIDGITRSLGKPTSQAQEYGGTNAEALNNYQMAEYLNGALNHGILRKEGQGKIQIGDQIIFETWDDNYEDFRKRRGATLLHTIMAIFRDFFIGALINGSWGFGKEVVKIK